MLLCETILRKNTKEMKKIKKKVKATNEKLKF